MTMQTSDLVAGQQTDALVALAQGWDIKLSVDWPVVTLGPAYMRVYSPSTNPAQWAELIPLLHGVIIEQDGDSYYIYVGGIDSLSGMWLSVDESIGLAICKAVIAAKWGDVIPDEIWEKVK